MPRRRRARRGRPRLPLRAGAARPGAADALHALARSRAARARHRARPRRPSARRSAQRLEELGMVQQLVADSVIDIEASRALIRWAALGARRGRARAATSPRSRRSTSPRPSAASSTARCRSAAALGVSRRPRRSRAYLGEVRPFRIYDGPSRDAPLGDRPPRRAPASASGEPGDVVDTASGRCRSAPLWCASARRHGLGERGPGCYRARTDRRRATRTLTFLRSSAAARASCCAARRGRRCRRRRTTCCARRACRSRSSGAGARVPRVVAVCEDESSSACPST